MTPYDYGKWTLIHEWSCPIRWEPGHIRHPFNDAHPFSAADEWFWLLDGCAVERFSVFKKDE